MDTPAVEVSGDCRSRIIQEWQEFYRKMFNLEYNFSRVVLPKNLGGYRHLFIADIPMERICEKYSQLFKFWRPTEKKLDELTVFNARNAMDSPYAILIKDEPEESLRGLSPREVVRRGFLIPTFTEGAIHALKFFDETGRHLDHNRISFCAGTRFKGINGDDSVPGLGWVTSLICDGEMRLGLNEQDKQNDRACFRSIIS